ncbi:MAG TPA: asparagine synthase-related protein [Bryobacteraceae bacterium]
MDFSDPSADIPWIHQAAIHLGVTPPARPVGRCFAGSFDASGIQPRHPFLKVTADAQLHNRDELIPALGMPRAEPEDLDDAALILAAYEKWGEDCPAFLLGEYSFAIWDSRKEALFLCRDHMGVRPLYYWQGHSRLAFASDPRSILRIPGVDRLLNRRKLSAMAVPGGQHLVPDETFHEGILSVPGACWLKADSTGLRKSTFWKPEIRENLVPKQPGEAFEALRALLFQAVECRIRRSKRPAALLSGGLDSSSLVSIAARCLEGSNRTLTTLSAVLADELRMQIADEREFIAEFQSVPNIRMEYLTAPGHGPFDFIEDGRQVEIAPVQTSRHYLYEAFEQAAAANGCDLILDGEGGEMGATCWAHGYYAELAAGFRWMTLAGELRRARAATGRSALRILAKDLRRMLPGRERKHAPVVLLADGFGDRSAKPVVRKLCRPSHQQFQLYAMTKWLEKHAVRGSWAATRHTRFSQPLRDKRVFDFCVSAPGNMKVRDGYPRYLVRGALDGILPKKIQWRTDKLPFSPDYYLRYNAQLGKAREFVSAIRENDPVRSVVDVERLRQMINPVDPSVGGEQARDIVPATIYLISFLRQFSEYRV